MSVIYPRSPREMMDGWVYLPRFVDKIRLHLAGKLGKDYQENFLNAGFDAYWVKSAGVDPQALVKVVKESITDGEVCDWVRKNVRRSGEEKRAFNEYVLNRGKTGEDVIARLEQRKKESGLEGRADITCFVDYIDADERRM